LWAMALTTLYTPQQLEGSVKYGSSSLMGNWREDIAVEEWRLADYMDIKGTAAQPSSVIKQRLGSQLDKVPLTTANGGVVRYGDSLCLRSSCNMGVLAASIGQALRGVSEVPRHPVSCAPPGPPVARCVLTISSYEGTAQPGDVVKYGDKVLLTFSEQLGVTGCLGSSRPNASNVGSSLWNKQEAYVELLSPGQKPSYDLVWSFMNPEVDQRLVMQGEPVPVAADLLIVHAFTGKRLAGTRIVSPTDFGSEAAVCVHTFTEAHKVHQLETERAGVAPVAICGGRIEEAENIWQIITA